jgi:hypothetical protein
MQSTGGQLPAAPFRQAGRSDPARGVWRPKRARGRPSRPVAAPHRGIARSAVAGATSPPRRSAVASGDRDGRALQFADSCARFPPLDRTTAGHSMSRFGLQTCRPLRRLTQHPLFVLAAFIQALLEKLRTGSPITMRLRAWPPHLTSPLAAERNIKCAAPCPSGIFPAIVETAGCSYERYCRPS